MPPQVSYVLDTEDVFRRPRKAGEEGAGHNGEARARKFEEWLAQKQQALMQQQAAAAQAAQQRSPMAPILEATAA